MTRRSIFQPFSRPKPPVRPARDAEPAPKPARVRSLEELAAQRAVDLRESLVEAALPAPCPVAVAEHLSYDARGEGVAVAVYCRIGDHEHQVIATHNAQARTYPVLVMPDDPLVMTPYTLLRIYSIGALERGAVVRFVGTWDYPEPDDTGRTPGTWQGTVTRALTEDLITLEMYDEIEGVKRDHERDVETLAQAALAETELNGW